MSMTQAVSCPLPVPPGHIQSRIQGESHRGEAIILIPKTLFSFIWLCTSLLLIGPFLVVFVFLCLSTYLATFHSFHILIHLCVHVWLIGEGTRLGIWGLQLRVLPRLTTFLGQRGPLVPSLIGSWAFGPARISYPFPSPPSPPCPPRPQDTWLFISRHLPHPPHRPHPSHLSGKNGSCLNSEYH